MKREKEKIIGELKDEYTPIIQNLKYEIKQLESNNQTQKKIIDKSIGQHNNDTLQISSLITKTDQLEKDNQNLKNKIKM